MQSCFHLFISWKLAWIWCCSCQTSAGEGWRGDIARRSWKSRHNHQWMDGLLSVLRIHVTDCLICSWQMAGEWITIKLLLPISFSLSSLLLVKFHFAHKKTIHGLICMFHWRPLDYSFEIVQLVAMIHWTVDQHAYYWCTDCSACHIRCVQVDPVSNDLAF